MAGVSPQSIAKLLNLEKVPGPGSKSKRGPTEWSPSTIYGNWKRGTGILNNELYVGRRSWNRQRFLKNPDTGKRVARRNPQSEWVVKDVPHLRIPGLTDELLARVRQRQESTRREMKAGRVRGRRPLYLFSKLTRCAECGAGYNLSSRDTLRCFNNEKRGTCSNGRTITRRELEGRVLRAMREKFFSDDAFAAFCEGFRAQMNELRMEQRERIAATKRELDRVTREIRGVIDAIKAGVPGEELKTEMEGLQARKAALITQMAMMEEPEPLLHPSIADVYRTRVEGLASALESDEPEQREAARSGLRALITKIEIPAYERQPLRVVGNLAEMLTAAGNRAAVGGVAQSGCGGSQPSEFGALVGGCVAHAEERVASSLGRRFHGHFASAERMRTRYRCVVERRCSQSTARAIA